LKFAVGFYQHVSSEKKMAQSATEAYNDFLIEQFEENVDQSHFLLYVVPHWSESSLLDGYVTMETAMTLLVKLHHHVEDKWLPQCLCTLFTLCQDPQSVIEMMEANGFQSSMAYQIFTKSIELERPAHPLLDALESFAEGKAEWIRAFLSSVAKFAWSQHLYGKYRGSDCDVFDRFLMTEYISFLMGMHPNLDNNTEVDEFFRTIQQSDLKGPRLTTVEDYGEGFVGTVAYCLKNSDFKQYMHMRHLVSVRQSPYTLLIRRPFYRFDASESLYALVEEISQMPLVIDLGDDGLTDENDCSICYEAKMTVSMDCCSQKTCPQCVLRILREPKTPLCPFCRAEIVSVTQLVS